MTSMMNEGGDDQDLRAALDALTSDYRSSHRACVRLVRKTNTKLADEITLSHSPYFENAGKADDPATNSYAVLLKRMGPIAELIPALAVATVPTPSLWAATGQLGKRWLVVLPGGVVSFYRAFCTTVFVAREKHKQSPDLDESIEMMSVLLGAHLEYGLVDFSGMEHLPQTSKPIIEHLTQLAYEFFLLHESFHVRERHQEPDARATTWYQEAHLRHANEFAADRWAFLTLMASFSNDLHLVTVAIAMLFDALELLDRFDFAPMSRLTHPSPATRKWRLMRLLEPPEAPEFLDQGLLNQARDFSMLYERLGAFIVDHAKPATPLNEILNWGAGVGSEEFVRAIIPLMARGDVGRIVENLARVRRSSQEWAVEATDPGDVEFAAAVNERIDSLARELSTERSLQRYALALTEASKGAG